MNSQGRRNIISPAAWQDLQRLRAFILRNSSSQRAANRMRDTLLQEINKVFTEPNLGQILSAQYSRLVVRFGKRSYVIRYRVTADTILITRIWHGKENRPPR